MKHDTEATLALPWPPTANHYWRHVLLRSKRGKERVAVLLSEDGRKYRIDVQGAVLRQGMPRLAGRLHVRIVAHPPDQRRRDLDNLLKSSLDALMHAGVYEDDSHIDRLEVERGPLKRDGLLAVTITTAPETGLFQEAV